MRFRGKAAVLISATLLSFSFASRTPLADKPKQKQWVPEVEGLTPAQVKKYQKSGLIPKYEPLNLKGTGKLAKMLKKARNIKPKDYQLDFIKETVANAKDLVYGMKINAKGTFVFKVKAVKLKNGKTLTADIKIESKEKIEKKLKKKKKDPLWRITFYTTEGKGYWVCGIPFKKLAKVYKEKTGEALQYVVFGMKKKEKGDIDFYIIPAATLEDAEKGEIKAGIPVLIIHYKADKDGFSSSFGRNVHNIVDKNEEKKDSPE
jgi:hypothetical protein